MLWSFNGFLILYMKLSFEGKIIRFEEYFTKHSENRLKHEGDVVHARESYYKYKPTNLIFLLGKRFNWMNDYIKKGDKVLEVGSGTGISKDFIRKDCNLILSDVEKPPWIDKIVNALDTKFKNNSFDVIMCSNMIHHVAYPKFFLERW